MSPSLCSTTLKTGPVRSHTYVVVRSTRTVRTVRVSIWSAFQKVIEPYPCPLRPTMREWSGIFIVSTSGFTVAVPQDFLDNLTLNGRCSHGMLRVDGIFHYHLATGSDGLSNCRELLSNGASMPDLWKVPIYGTAFVKNVSKEPFVKGPEPWQFIFSCVWRVQDWRFPQTPKK